MSKRGPASSLAAFAGLVGMLVSVALGGASSGGWYVLTEPVCAFVAGYGLYGVIHGGGKR